MMELPETLRSPNLAAKFALYAVKAIVVFALAYGVGALAAFAPPLATGIAWALLSCAAAIAASYPYVIKRLNTAGMYRPGSFIHNRVNGRLVIVLANTVVSAVLMASLILEMHRWEAREWVLAAISIPAYFLIALGMAKWSEREYERAFVKRGTMLWSLWATGILLALLYLALTFLWPPESHSSLGATFASTGQLFANSPSDLMAEIGKWEYVVQCLTLFGHDVAMKAPLLISAVFNAVSCVLTAFAISHLLTLCSLSLAQVKQVFLPLDESAIGTQASTAKNALYLLVGFAILTGAFGIADTKTGELRNSEFYSIAEESVRLQTNLTVYQVDGKNFAKDTVESTMANVLENDNEARTARENLTAAINAAYGECADRVDAYLDWYFNPLSGFERIWNSLGNSASSRLAEEYQSRIGEALDEADIQEQIEAYNATRDGLKSQVESTLEADYEHGIPDWMVANVRTLDEFPQFQRFDATLELEEPEGEYTGIFTDREEYRQAILDAIEASRAKALENVE